MIVRRVEVLSLGKILGLIYALLGLIFGLILSLISVLGMAAGAAFQDTSGPEALIGSFFGVGAIILLPIFYGILGLVGGLVSAALYNLAARLVGGLKLTVE